MLPRTIGVVVLVLTASVTGAVSVADSGGLAAADEDDGGWGIVPGADAPTMDGDDGDDGPEPLQLTTANSTAAFRAYVYRGQRAGGDYDVTFDRGRRVRTTATPVATATESATVDAQASADGAAASAGGGGGAAARRVGETNVQVVGVDEPDVVKTVGDRFYVRRAGVGVDDAGTSVVAATPPADARVTGALDRSGRMLVGEDRVVVLPNREVQRPVEPDPRGGPTVDPVGTVGGVADSVLVTEADREAERVAAARTLTGYDVSDPDAPTETWERDVEGRVVSARLVDGRVLLVVANDLPTPGEPCRVQPLADVTIPCTDVRHPDEPVPAEMTYSVLSVDAASGDLQERTTFVGSHDATVYVSPDAVYATYTTSERQSALRTEFLLQSAVVPEHVQERLRAVRGYDLSPGAEREEVEATVRGWLSTLAPAERERVSDRLREAQRDYLRDHRRDATATHVVRFPVGDLEDSTTGVVPGIVLNQFSFDVHDGHLRVATTVGEQLHGVESANDVYVLDATTLERTGSVTGMSEGQRVYGVRFDGDRGYVVTFRQVDPLHVLDLSDPAAPTEEGSVKLPGFSSYLHPLGDERVMGIGEEDGHVKAVIFDVSDATDPRVAESRILDARWSAISETHHAFTYDPRHDVAFLPTPDGGYVLSTDDLDTERQVLVDDPRRARYVGDHLFVFGTDRAVVLNETDWSRTTTVDLGPDGET